MLRFHLPANGLILGAALPAAVLLISSTLLIARPAWSPLKNWPAENPPPALQQATPAGAASSGESDAGAAPSTPTPEPATPTPEPTATPTPEPTATPGAVVDWNKVRPNELGRIMILEYHMLGPTEDRWTRSYDNFRKDLERLYRGGYRPIGLNEYVENRIDVPAGTTPIIFTFDDSSPGQFRYIPGPDGKPEVDPSSAVGIWIAFNKEHPDWRFRGTFNVLAGVEEEHRLFAQPEYAADKLRRLVDMGFELGNHTYWHMQLGKLDKENVNKQLALAVKAIQEAVPGYTVNTLSLPLGMHPKEQAWAVRGSYGGVEYHHRAILEVSGGGAYSPSSREADPLSLPRIQATHQELDFYKTYLDHYDQHPEERYVSDGDPDRLVLPASAAQDYRAATGDTPLPEPAPGFKAVKLR